VEGNGLNTKSRSFRRRHEEDTACWHAGQRPA